MNFRGVMHSIEVYYINIDVKNICECILYIGFFSSCLQLCTFVRFVYVRELNH